MNHGKAALNTSNTIELPIIDWELCVKLANHKEDIAEEVLSLVIQQLPLDLHTIKEASEKKDYPELLRYVHKMHGALCYTGLPRLKNIVLQLETLLKQKTTASMELISLLKALETAVQQVLSSPLPY